MAKRVPQRLFRIHKRTDGKFETRTEDPRDSPLGVDITINGFQSISREDVAAFMLDQIDRPDYVGKKPIVYAK